MVKSQPSQTGIKASRYHWFFDATINFNLGEPNNHGGKVPGEDCTIAHLFADDMKWYDAPCSIRGFSMGDTVVSFNPLCEHNPFEDFGPKYKVEGIDQVF